MLDIHVFHPTNHHLDLPIQLHRPMFRVLKVFYIRVIGEGKKELKLELENLFEGLRRKMWFPILERSHQLMREREENLSLTGKKNFHREKSVRERE